MKANKAVKIVTDINTFAERVDEITSADSYDYIKETISKLKDALYANPECPALAAPQIGESLRLFVVRLAKTETERFKVYLNPLIISSEGTHLSRETCISIPNKQYIVPRKNKLHIAYQEADGHVNSETFIGAFAEVMQQMIELLDGITLADYGLDLDDVGGPKAFDRASKKMQAELISMYLETLKSYNEELAAEIKADPKLDHLNKTIDFMTGMLKGDIVPIKPEEETEAK